MFVSSTHLPQVLSHDAYRCAEIFQRERERLFLPAWHCVGCLDDLPRDGDYATCRLLDHELLLWRQGEQVRAFLNVCAHRYSALVGQARGHCGQRIRCQYHGWEYDFEGDTKKIPDAKNFKPLEHGALGLHRFPTEVLGHLIFVRLSAGGPSLREHLGDVYPRIAAWFSTDWRHVASIDQTSEANWKVVTENAVESYHVDMVHPKTFGTTPEDRLCAHELHDRWTMFLEDLRERTTLPARLGRLACWLTKVPTDDHYKHLLVYPNFMAADMGLFTFVQSVLPVSPTQTRSLWRVFCNSGRRGSLRARIMWPGLALWARDFFPRIIAEDGAIQAAVQRGLSAAAQPNGGLISAREERIFHFQRFVQRALSDEAPVPPS